MAEPQEGSITVDYEEVDGSPVEALADRGFEATRTLECAFADRLTLAQELRGGLRLVGEEWVYTPPQPYPHYPAARAQDVRIEPFGATVAGGDPHAIAYSLARLSVVYRVPDHGETGPEALASESLEPVVEFLTMPHEKLYWDAGGSQMLCESEAPGRLLRMVDWVYIRYKLITIPPGTLELVGKVNNVELVSTTLGLVFPPQTLLYNPPQLEREVTTDGVKTWKVTYRLTYRPETWNKFPRGGSEVMQTIYKADGGGFSPFQPYEPADFSPIMG